MTTKSGPTTTPLDTLADRGRTAEASAGRAAGYCWIRHPATVLFCTRPAGHAGQYHHYYQGVDWH